MSVWTSKYAIMRDLSKAQGRVVPVDMNSTVGVAVAANEKPPQLASEETEEEFYNYACGDVDYSTAPDFGLIQKMLEMVKGDDDSSDTSVDGDLIQISKLNGQSKLANNSKKPNDIKVKPNDFKKPKDAKIKINEAKTKLNSFNDCKENSVNAKLKEANVIPMETKPSIAGGATIKKKQQRNCAVISLLAALESKEKNEPLKLLKPTDFITTKAVTESVRKVDEWFTNKENAVPKGNAPMTISSLTSIPMFKKKSVSEKSVKQSQRRVKPETSPSKSMDTYKPSSEANEYYQKLLEKSQLNNCIKEDIWQKAERLMKEADAKRAAKAAEMDEASTITEAIQESLIPLNEMPGLPDLSEPELPELPDSESSTKLELVALSEQRHASTEDVDCLVCDVVRKHGYSIHQLSHVE